MGNTSYNISSRSARAETLNYATASVNTIFTQNQKRVVHKDMDSRGITIREARDSQEHPNTVPIIVALDFTGSMGHIPHELIKEGLPKMVGAIIQNGIPDPALLFLGIGDHETDNYPLQVGQFESGDEELDMWLTQSYIEGGGGGNAGESYGLAHYFAARHCVTDAWEKRGQKGILITIGDEPNLKNYPTSAMKSVMDNGDIKAFTDAEILAEAQEKWEVYHILPGRISRGADSYWGQLLGDNCIDLDHYSKVAETIKDIVCNVVESCGVPTQPKIGNVGETKEEIL